METALPAERLTRIQPTRGWGVVDLRLLWSYRELLFILLWRDIKANYRQMALGPLWMVIRPVMSMLVFSLVFGNLLKTPNDGLPYPLFFYSALLPWSYFTTALNASSTSLTTNMHLISKVFFPRLIIPIASVLAGLIDLAISFLVLLGLMLYFGYYPGPGVVFLPIYLLLAAGTALGMGLWMAALSVKYRDVAFGMSYLTQAWMYASPVVYASSAVNPQWRFAYHLNPMTQVIDGFRWCLLGRAAPDGPALAISFAIVAAVLITGASHFQRAERTVVDLL